MITFCHTLFLCVSVGVLAIHTFDVFLRNENLSDILTPPLGPQTHTHTHTHPPPPFQRELLI